MSAKPLTTPPQNLNYHKLQHFYIQFGNINRNVCFNALRKLSSQSACLLFQYRKFSPSKLLMSFLNTRIRACISEPKTNCRKSWENSLRQAWTAKSGVCQFCVCAIYFRPTSCRTDTQIIEYIHNLLILIFLYIFGVNKEIFLLFDLFDVFTYYMFSCLV